MFYFIHKAVEPLEMVDPKIVQKQVGLPQECKRSVYVGEGGGASNSNNLDLPSLKGRENTNKMLDSKRL